MTQAGFFSVEQGCILKSADFFIYTHRQGQSQIQIASKIQSPEISQLNHIINLTLPDPIREDKTDMQDYMMQLQDIQKQIDIMKQDQPLIDRVSYNDIHHYAAIYILLVTVVIIVTVLAWRHFNRPIGAPATPSAAPSAAPWLAPPVPGLAPRATSSAPVPAPAAATSSTSTSEQCYGHYGEVSELKKKSARIPIKPKRSLVNVQTEQVLLKDTGSSPVVKRAVFDIQDNFDSSKY
ncbi:hypothetical protein O0L34_g12950 [Tuta absoluta]|nr:hypothetical protein O0L34_g12950 [Tuta absoluta]